MKKTVHYGIFVLSNKVKECNFLTFDFKTIEFEADNSARRLRRVLHFAFGQNATKDHLCEKNCAVRPSN